MVGSAHPTIQVVAVSQEKPLTRRVEGAFLFGWNEGGKAGKEDRDREKISIAVIIHSFDLLQW